MRAEDSMGQDVIEIAGLVIAANHGCFEHERRDGQRFVLDLRLFLDLSRAGLTDDLDATVHYGEVVGTVRRLFTERAFNLIEAAALHVLAGVLAEYPAIQRLRIKVHKPHAPIEAEFAHVACVMERARGYV
jgi:dihydroneopterin aldolase